MTPAPTTVTSMVRLSFGEHAHRAPAADHALAMTAHGFAVDNVDLGHEPEGGREAGDLVRDVFVAVYNTAVGLEFHGVGGLVIGDAVSVHLALSGGQILELVED